MVCGTLQPEDPPDLLGYNYFHSQITLKNKTKQKQKNDCVDFYIDDVEAIVSKTTSAVAGIKAAAPNCIRSHRILLCRIVGGKRLGSPWELGESP